MHARLTGVPDWPLAADPSTAAILRKLVELTPTADIARVLCHSPVDLLLRDERRFLELINTLKGLKSPPSVGEVDASPAVI